MGGEDESYDLAHFECIVRAAGRIRRAHSAVAPHMSVRLHCEIADIPNACTQRVARDGSLAGLRGSRRKASRPRVRTPRRPPSA